MSDKEDHPPLLTAGFHPMSVADLRLLCVTNFATSTRRPMIMEGLEAVLLIINETGLKAEAWIDGSFLTEKLDPEDSDLVIRVSGWDYALASPVQQHLMNWINVADLKPEYLCDSYCFVEYEKGHPLGGMGEWQRAYWIRQFGFSRAGKMKGLAVVTLPFTP